MLIKRTNCEGRIHFRRGEVEQCPSQYADFEARHPLNQEGIFIEDEEQSKRRLKIVKGAGKIAGMQVKTIYRAPENPEAITDPVPLLIIHGWLGTQGAYAKLAEEVAQQGKPSITFGENRSLGLLADLNPLNLLKAAKLSSQASWEAIRFVRNHEEIGSDVVDAYGHSWGGQTAVDLTLQKPDHIRSLVLDGSCGLDIHTLPEMLRRTKEVGAKELRPVLGSLVLDGNVRIVPEALHYIFRNFPRTVAEGLDAGSANLHEKIKQLTDKDKKIAAIHSRQDTYFPIEAVQRDCGDLFTIFRQREDELSNHFAPQLDPAGTAKDVLWAINELNGQPILDMAA